MSRHTENRAKKRRKTIERSSEPLDLRDVLSLLAGLPSITQKSMERGQNRPDIEQLLGELRQSRTMHQRITRIQNLQSEDRDRLRQRDPELTAPIFKGLEKRRARLEKAAILYHRLTEGDMSGRKIDYRRLADEAFDVFHPLFNPEWASIIPGQYHEQLDDAILDLTDVLKETEQRRNDRKAEITGVTNAICCAHDLLSVFKEAEATPPKIYTRIHRRLEKRRAFLDPDYSKGHHL